MTSTDRQVSPASATGGLRPPVAEDRLGSWWVLAAATLLMLSVLGWRFVADPSLAAPTRDPAWYTWRANVVMEDDPGSVVGDWGPDGLFSGGYRVTVPLEGALLQRVAGIDTYSMAKLLMLGVPILTGLALGAGAARSRKDPVAFLTMLLATVALFLTTPYVGYLDNITVLFLLSLMLAFLGAARTSWGARTALFLIGIAAAFTHPTTCVLFGATLLAVFGFHFVTSRFRLGEALRSDGPMLFSVGLGMFVGLASWVVGIWGTTASLKEAALPPPYTKAFFVDRLLEWIGSMQPVIVVPFIALAIGSTILLARRRRLARGYLRRHRELVAVPAARDRVGRAGRQHPGLRRSELPGRPLLPVHERDRRADGARGARGLRTDLVGANPAGPPVAPPGLHAGRRYRRGRLARGRGEADGTADRSVGVRCGCRRRDRGPRGGRARPERPDRAGSSPSPLRPRWSSAPWASC